MEIIEPINLNFEGNGIKPSAVKASEIAELIKSFEASIIAIAKKQYPELNEDLVNLSLEEIKEGSLLIKTIPHIVAVSAAVSILGSSFKNNNFDDYSEITLKNIKYIASFAKKHDCEGYIYHGKEKIASFDKNTNVRYSDKGTVSGETTIYGEVKRAGGDNPRVSLRINGHYNFSFDAPKDITVQLAANLYKEIGLIGKARWDKYNYRILEFSPTEIIFLNEESLKESFDNMSEFFSREDLDNLDLII